MKRTRIKSLLTLCLTLAMATSVFALDNEYTFKLGFKKRY